MFHVRGRTKSSKPYEQRTKSPVTKNRLQHDVDLLNPNVDKEDNVEKVYLRCASLVTTRTNKLKSDYFKRVFVIMIL
jgi:hypothetical protein